MQLTPRLIEGAVQAAAADALRWFRPTRSQLAMLRDERLRVQYRGPNQAGKTTVLAVDLLDLMLGRGEWQPGRPAAHPPPVTVWVVCASWKQSLTVQGKVHEMVPWSQVAPGTKFSRRKGFAGAAFELRNGSLCRFMTVGQDLTTLASATLDAVLVDEPPPEDAWAEFSQRVSTKQGQIRLYYTPVHKPTQWLERKVEAGEIHEHHFALRLQEVWPIGRNGPALVPFISQQVIDQKLIDVPPHLRAQMLEGAWRGVPVGAYFPSFDAARHVVWPPHHADVEWRVAVGFDFGTAPGKMSAALVFVRDGHTTTPEILFVDGICAEGDETWDGQELAIRTREMLERHGLGYAAVDRWVGDRSAQARRSNARMDVNLMRGHLRIAFNVPSEQTRAVHKARKGAGSVLEQCSVIDGRFRRGTAWVAPTCPAKLRDFFVSFDGDERDPLKDIGDAARYAAIALLNLTLCYRYSGSQAA